MYTGHIKKLFLVMFVVGVLIPVAQSATLVYIASGDGVITNQANWTGGTVQFNGSYNDRWNLKGATTYTADQGTTTLSSGRTLSVGNGSDEYGNLTISGGTLVLANSSGTGNSACISTPANNNTSTGIVTLAGGDLIVSNEISIAVRGSSSAYGELTINSNSTFRADIVSYGVLNNGSPKGVINLNTNGTMHVRRILDRRGAVVKELYFDGGTLKIHDQGAGGGNLISSDIDTYMKVGGLTIDTDGFDKTLGDKIEEDSGSAGGGLIKTGAGTLSLNSNQEYTGGTTVNEGTLLLTSSSGGTGNIRGELTVNAGATVNWTRDNNAFGYNGTGRSVNKVNIYGGTVGGAELDNHFWDADDSQFELNMRGGTLYLGGGDNDALGPVITILETNVTANILQVGGNNDWLHLRGNSDAVFDVADGSQDIDLLMTAGINEDGVSSVIKTGPGTMEMQLRAVHEGGTTVSNGTLILNFGDSGGYAMRGALTIHSNATVRIDKEDALGTVGAGAVSDITIYQGTLTNNTATRGGARAEFNLTGAKVTASAGGYFEFRDDNDGINSLSDSEESLFAADAVLRNSGLPIDTEDGTADVDLRMSGVISDGDGSSGPLTKTGDGTLLLEADSTYTNGTVISGGTLLVDGDNSAADGAVSVNGGTLGGSGTVGGDVTVASGATLSPGNSVGTLTFSDNVILESGSTYDFEVGDLLAVSGDLTLNNATLDIDGTISGTTTVATVTGTIAGAFTGFPEGTEVQTGYYIHYESDRIVIDDQLTVPPVVSITSLDVSSAERLDEVELIVAVTAGGGSVTNVVLDLSNVGGSSEIQLGTTAGTFTNTFTVGVAAQEGEQAITVTAYDNAGLSGLDSTNLTVIVGPQEWTGGEDSSWNNLTNWANFAVPESGSTVIFNGDGNGNTNISLGAGGEASTLLFDTADAAAYTIGTSAQTLALDIAPQVVVRSSVTNDQEVAADISIADADLIITNNSATGTLTLSGDISDNGSALDIIKEGVGTVAISGVVSNAGNLFANGGELVFSGTATNLTDLHIGGSLPGTFTQTGGSLEVTGEGGTHYSLGLNTNGVHNMSGGTFTSSSQYHTLGRFYDAVYNQTAGTVTVTKANAQYLNLSGSAGITTVMNISGGSFWTDAAFRVGNKGVSTLNISGTAVVTLVGGNDMVLGRSGETSGGTVNLDGGTLILDQIKGGDGSNELNLNGGVIKVNGSQGELIQASITNANVKAGGAVIDTDGNDTTIVTALQEDAVSTGGGLTKNGTGTLTLNQANTYTGPTLVSGGTLLINGDNSVATGTVAVATNAVLGGTGFIGGSVTVSNGATLNAGDGIGNLTCLSNVVFESGSTNVVEIGAGTSCDTLIITNGSLTIGSGVTLSIVGTIDGPGRTIAIYDNADSGTFDGLLENAQVQGADTPGDTSDDYYIHYNVQDLAGDYAGKRHITIDKSSSGPTSSGIDLRAFQTSEGVVVEFAAYDVEADGSIELQLLDDEGNVIWSGSVDVTAGPISHARFLVPGLELGQSYSFRVKDEVGKWWDAPNVTVQPFAAEMVSANLAGITLQFDTLPDHEYEIQWTDELGGEWTTVTSVVATASIESVVVESSEENASGFYRVKLK